MSAAVPFRPSVEDVLRPVSRYWWLWAVFGVLSIVAGVIALANPGLSLVAIGILFGCWLIVTGFFDVLAGVAADDASAARRVVAVLLGVVSLIAGLMCLRLPGAGVLALVIVAGSYLIVSGVLLLAAAVGDDQPGLAIALGLANLVLGVLILALPQLSLVTFAVLFGIGLILRGAVALAAAVRLRRLGAHRTARAVPRSSARAVGS
jgi:hypothetical protein